MRGALLLVSWIVAAAVCAAVAPLPARAADGVRYEVVILGAPTDEIDALLQASSRLISAKDAPPATRAALDRRISDDVATFRAVFRSEGYYGAEILASVDPGEGDALDVAVAIAPGPLYLFAGLDIVYRGAPADGLPGTGEELGLDLGMTARAAPLAAVEETLLRQLEESGYPRPDVAEKRWVVDHDRTVLSGRFVVDLGDGAARFGPLRITGLDRVKEGYVRALLAWRTGAPYDIRTVEAARRTLSETGLFDVVVVEPDEEADGRPGTLPMVARLEEHARRSISAGASFATDEGMSAEVGWRHRNLFGSGESLRLGAFASASRQEATAVLARPNVIRKGQTVELSTRVGNEESDAFDEIVAEQSLSLSWPVGEKLRLSAGPTLAFSRIEERTEANNFALLGFFVSATYDDTDDPLDPTRGFKLGWRVHPNASFVGTEVGFISSDVTASVYRAVIGEDRVVLAARGRIGTTAGAATEDIPASYRFYSGGGGSVRGFGFREVGPLRPNNDPLGGRSVVEAGLEARIRVFGDVGLVPFLDLGQVFDSSIPNAEGGILYAAGLGLRYYTPIGPVRLDVARPLNPREVDDEYQLYISIGQAF